MDDLSEQIDEIEALVAIYGKEWQTDDESNRSYSIDVGKKRENSVKLHIKLPKNYPSTVSPIYEMSAPHLSQSQKNHITDLLDEGLSVKKETNQSAIGSIEILTRTLLSRANLGQNVIFQLVERVREALESDFKVPMELEIQDKLDTEDINTLIVTRLSSNIHSKCPDITHGDVIVDRKSSFQGHAAVVTSTDQVKQVLHKLYENKKIKQATHNMFAYRIFREDIKSFAQDCEDDGESQAGGRLLHLLQIIEVKNVMVVVTRWYGGVHLGSDRFRHINNAARQVLTAANLIPDKIKKKS